MPTRHLAIAASIAAMLLVPVTAITSLAGGMILREASLTPGGMAFEVNTDAAGKLFISDYDAGEIWQLEPTTSTYTRYLGLPYPSDARPDHMGNIWWTDWDKTLGEINVLTGTATTWVIEPDQLPQTLGGLAIDEAGRVWIATHSYYSTEVGLYRFDPQTDELCKYAWEGGSASYYIVYDAGQVWLGDEYWRRIIRFDPAVAQDQVRWWSLAAGASPTGLALDAAGHLWWADFGANALVRLDPDSNLVTTYTLTPGSYPEMLIFDEGRAWYTTTSGSVGALDPAVASGTVVPAATGSLTSTSASCRSMGTGATTTVSTAHGTLAWGASSELAPVVDAGGWTIYQLPDGADLYGIARSSGSLWVADNGRQKLVRLGDWEPLRVFLPFVVR